MHKVARLLNQRTRIELRGTAEEQGLLAVVLLAQSANPALVATYAAHRGVISATTIPGIDPDFASFLDGCDSPSSGLLSIKYLDD